MDLTIEKALSVVHSSYNSVGSKPHRKKKIPLPFSDADSELAVYAFHIHFSYPPSVA